MIANQTDNRPIPIPKQLDEFQEKFSLLPISAQDWIYSLEAADNNAKIAEKFKLASDQNPILAGITGDAILKSFRLEALPARLQQDLSIDQEKARQIALEIAVKQLLIIRDHLRDVESFILKLGGTVPKNLPEFIDSDLPSPTPLNISKRPFREAIHENKEILNQLLTANPIKITDFEQPVRPTIKNWLSDYVKQKGAGHHDELERGNYLFTNENAKNLFEEDRAKLSMILKAYDEDIEVPISPESKLILIDELTKPEPAAPKEYSNDTQPAQPAALQPAPITRTGPDTYREPVAQEDLTGPLKQPTKPAPKLNGNIINLRDFGEKQ